MHECFDALNFQNQLYLDPPSILLFGIVLNNLKKSTDKDSQLNFGIVKLKYYLAVAQVLALGWVVCTELAMEYLISA